jgi:hypothetical protein
MKNFEPLMSQTFAQRGRKLIDRRISVGSSFAFVLFAAAMVLVASLWLIEKKPRSSFLNLGMSTSMTDESLAFRKISVADGKTDDGFRYTSFVYKASDCVPIFYEVNFFDSSVRAQNELQKQIGKAPQILQQGAEIDDKGNVIGERYVANINEFEHAKPQTAVMLTRNSNLISITSTSFQHVLEFEKASKTRKDPSAFPGLDSLSRVTFKSSGTTRGFTNESVRFVREDFTSSDCEQLVTYAWYFDSPEKAQEEFNNRLRGAVEVSEQSEKLNRGGERVGERAVAYFKAEESSEYLEIAKIIWTEGSVLHSIEGAYVYALQFENQQKGLHP